jgi:hypothetical protein
MRKTKPDNLKAERLQLAVPQSFARYAQVTGCSQLFQEMLAERVLGVSRPEFRQMYAGEPDIRFKPEPLEKAYIRAARWILESKVHKIWQTGSMLIFKVEWTVTGNQTLCGIKLAAGPGFKNVIYDDILNQAAMQDGIVPPAIAGEASTKLKIVQNWANYSYCGPEATND